MLLKCCHCNKLFENEKQYRKKYCSEKCRNKVHSQKNSGEKHPFYGKSHSNFGSKRTEKQKRCMSEAATNRVKKNGGLVVNFNKCACKWFDLFDLVNNTEGKYATKNGEKHIEDTPYFVDYFNSSMKLIMEWDEPSHLTENKVRKDKLRQEEIKLKYPNFDFIRIIDKNINFTSIEEELKEIKLCRILR